MKIQVKIIPDSKATEWIGWFGECLKVRVSSSLENADQYLQEFFAKDIGIPTEMIKISSDNQKDFRMIEVPDKAYEIIMSNVASFKD